MLRYCSSARRYGSRSRAKDILGWAARRPVHETSPRSSQLVKADVPEHRLCDEEALPYAISFEDGSSAGGLRAEAGAAALATLIKNDIWHPFSHALLQHRSDAAGSLPRIPAAAIEGLVSDRVARLISADPAAVRRDPSSMAESIRQSLRRVEVSDRRVTLHVHGSTAANVEAVQHRLAPTDMITESGGVFTVAIPIRLKSWGGEIVIEGPNGASANTAIHLDQKLIDALVLAHEWRDLLASGKAKSFRAIARQVGCTEGYVRQIVGLAFLAPAITASILRGTQARHLTTDWFDS